MSKFDIYTDGSSLGNPGPCGFGVVIFKDGEYFGLCREHKDKGTNNEMEISAVIEALSISADLLTEFPNSDINIYMDSSYVLNSLTDWIPKWIKNDWKRPNGEDVKNLSLMKSLWFNYTTDFLNCQVKLHKVKGHNKIPGNEAADALARQDLISFEKIMAENGTPVR